MKWIQKNQEVYKASSNIVMVNAQDIRRLKDQVLETPNKRVRICVHQNPDDHLHEMLIVIAKGSYVRPHKHIDKSESFHMIEGQLDVVIFDDVGEILEIIPMGDPSSGKNFFYRLSSTHFHSLILRTDLVVFHETTRGPFFKEDTIWASWSPEVGNPSEKKFQLDLENRMFQKYKGLENNG